MVAPPISSTAKPLPHGKLKPISKPCAVPNFRDGVREAQASPQQPIQSFLGNSTTLWASALAFCLDAFDVEFPDSAQLFKVPDSTVHLWVSSQIPEAWRNIFFGDILSNVFIIAPLASWWFLDQNKATEDEHSLESGEITSVEFVGMASGATVLMMVFKQLLLPRDRPCLSMSSLSFPSGHTMEAVMLTSMFLMQVEFAAQRSNHHSMKNSILKLKSVARVAVAFAAVVTATGRIGADVHWVSDTIAGASMGLYAASLLANLHRWRRAKN